MSISKLAEQFAEKLNKMAASKEQVPRKRLSKILEKEKLEYSKKKKMLDGLEAEAEKLNSKVDQLRGECQSDRKNIMKKHQALSNMDMANASDVIFYNDDSSDTGYVIDGKEYHLEIDDMGDLKLFPMRKHRAERKQKPEENEVSDQEPSMEVADEDVDNLYLNLTE